MKVQFVPTSYVPPHSSQPSEACVLLEITFSLWRQTSSTLAPKQLCPPWAASRDSDLVSSQLYFQRMLLWQESTLWVNPTKHTAFKVLYLSDSILTQKCNFKHNSQAWARYSRLVRGREIYCPSASFLGTSQLSRSQVLCSLMQSGLTSDSQSQHLWNGSFFCATCKPQAPPSVGDPQCLPGRSSCLYKHSPAPFLTVRLLLLGVLTFLTVHSPFTAPFLSSLPSSLGVTSCWASQRKHFLSDSCWFLPPGWFLKEFQSQQPLKLERRPTFIAGRAPSVF